MVAAIVAATVSSAPARAADEVTFLGQIPGTWYTLGVDNETRECGAKADFTNGVSVVMVHIPQSGQWFFSLRHGSWRLQEGRYYDGSVSVDGKLFTGESRAITEQAIGLPISKEFMHAFTAGSNLTIHHTSGVALATISLAGTSKMVEAVARCSEVMQAQAQQQFQQQPFGPPKTYSVPEMPFAPKADGNAGRRFAGPERAA